MSPDTPQENRWSGHGIMPARYLRFFGMQRAGNHGVIDLVLRNAIETGTVFLNNCRPRMKPFQSYANLLVNRRDFGGMRDGGAPLSDILSAAGKAPLLVLSYENYVPTETETGSSGNFDDRCFSASVFVVRSFCNWYASMAKLERDVQFVKRQDQLEADLRILRFAACYAETCRNAHRLCQRSGWHIVLFDKWCSDEPHRKAMIEKLAGNLREWDLGQTQKFGAGSSFEKLRGIPDPEKLNERWRSLFGNAQEMPLLRVLTRDAKFKQSIDLFFPGESDRLTAITHRPAA